MSGTVTEMTPAGPLSVVGVRVALTDAGNARFVVSDQNGHYSIPNLHNGAVQVQSTRNGFETDSRVVMLEGDTRFDIQLIRIPPPPTFTVSGVVFEMTAAGQVPVQGVWMWCDDCDQSDIELPLLTDANGFYTFSGLTNGVHPLLLSKSGYSVVAPTPGHGPGETAVTVNGDTRFDIQLAKDGSQH
jgi:hypothetical protein